MSAARNGELRCRWGVGGGSPDSQGGPSPNAGSSGEWERECGRESREWRHLWSWSWRFHRQKVVVGGGGEHEHVQRGTSESLTLSTAPLSWLLFMWDMAIWGEDTSAHSSKAFPLFWLGGLKIIHTWKLLRGQYHTSFTHPHKGNHIAANAAEGVEDDIAVTPLCYLCHYHLRYYAIPSLLVQ